MEIPWALNSSRSYWDPGTILLAPVDFYVLLALFFFSPSSKPSFLLLYIFLITNKGISCILRASMGFLHGSVVKNMPTVQEMQETQIWFLNKEDPLEEGMTTHSNILAWRIPWTEESGGLRSMGLQRVRLRVWLKSLTWSIAQHSTAHGISIFRVLIYRIKWCIFLWLKILKCYHVVREFETRWLRPLLYGENPSSDDRMQPEFFLFNLY